MFTNRVVETLQVHYAETQSWYYLQDQQPSELLIFQQADSAKGKNSGMSDAALGKMVETMESLTIGQGVPHTSFANPLAGPDELPRESIEVRTLVSWGDVY